MQLILSIITFGKLETNTISFGVPQGNILGLILLIIYVKDLLDLPLPGADVIWYADDTAVIFRDYSWERTLELAGKGMSCIADG